MVGKLEKSNGLNAFIATIRISKESKILLVKNISSKKDGKGRTIIATSINIPRGSPIFLITGLIWLSPRRLSVISMTYSPGQNYDYFQ